MITISREERRNVIVWSCIFGFLIAQLFSFAGYLLIPSSWGWKKIDFLIIDLVLIVVLSIIISVLILFGVKFSSSIRINR